MWRKRLEGKLGLGYCRDLPWRLGNALHKGAILEHHISCHKPPASTFPRVQPQGERGWWGQLSHLVGPKYILR